MRFKKGDIVKITDDNLDGVDETGLPRIKDYSTSCNQYRSGSLYMKENKLTIIAYIEATPNRVAASYIDRYDAEVILSFHERFLSPFRKK